MSFTLQELVIEVRDKLGEQLPRFWSQSGVIRACNTVIQEFCSEAQSLETAIKIQWPGLKPEMPLPLYMENVTDVAIFMGQLFQLDELENFSDVQVANRASGIPQSFYTKVGTTVMSPQGTPTNQTPDIVLVPLTQQPNGQEPTTVMGLFPMPASDAPVTIWGTRFHGFVDKPQNLVQIPRRFLSGVAYGVVKRLKENEGMLDEANYYKNEYMAARNEFVNYSICRRAIKSFPNYGGGSSASLQRGSSSVIFIDQNPGLINQ